MSALTASVDSTLLVFALKEEAQNLFDGFHTIYTGVGKVNAAYQLMLNLAHWKEKRGAYPELVLNVGSAGSSLFGRGSVVNCTQFIQRDMDATAFGHTRYATPYEDVAPVLSAGLRCESYPQGVCGSGDNFATDGTMRGWNVVDMEAYALAKVCVGQNVPFCCLKYISDGADDQAAATWGDALTATAQALQKAVRSIVVHR
ncbi:MAG TPA: nucleosidase [Rhodospirillaceae bacterium]|nr:nucleosidase [Rhodospirillaceae bacterium]